MGSTTLHKSRINPKAVTRLIMAGAWIAIIAIAYATLTHVGFVYAIYYKLAPVLMGPEMRTYAHFVHVLAFVLLGALFTFAYPHRVLVVAFIVLGGAAFLEFAQTLTPDRHGTFIDALEKIGGGTAGILLVKAIQHIRDKGKIGAE
jgi:VanZ family protein